MSELEERFRFIKKLLEHVNDPVRYEILILFFTFGELTCKMISNILGKTKAGVSYQLKKLVESEVISFSEGSDGTKFYLIDPIIPKKYDFDYDPITELQDTDSKTIQLLNMDIYKFMFKFTSRIFSDMSEYYGNLKTEIECTQQNFEIPNPFYKYSLNFLSKELYQRFEPKIAALNQEIDECINQMGRKKKTVRTHLVINTIIPLIPIIESKKKYNSSNRR
jgi:hypothetical protein